MQEFLRLYAAFEIYGRQRPGLALQIPAAAVKGQKSGTIEEFPPQSSSKIPGTRPPRGHEGADDTKEPKKCEPLIICVFWLCGERETPMLRDAHIPTPAPP